MLLSSYVLVMQYFIRNLIHVLLLVRLFLLYALNNSIIFLVTKKKISEKIIVR